MFGAIMPQPLAIPPMVKPSPWTTASLGLVSVVRIASAASVPPSRDRLPASVGVAPRIVSIGSGKPISPVELTSISPASQPIAAAAAAHIASASARPGAPVPALALPELTITPAARPPLAASRSRQASIGGAANLLVVNTAAHATGRPSSVAISARSGFAGLIPACIPDATKPKAAVTLTDKLPYSKARHPHRARASNWRTGSSAPPRPCPDCRSPPPRPPSRSARQTAR